MASAFSGRRDAALAAASAALSAPLLPAPALAAAASGAALAGKPLQLPPLGIGAWAWGDRLFWGYDEKQDADIKEAFDTCVNSGITLFDTAEIYGPGRSEELLGRFLRESGKASDTIVATKFAALPWKTNRSDVVSACKASLERLGTDSIGLYQIHFPSPWKNEAFWDGLGDCYEQGLVKGVGVSNYGSEALRGVHKSLADRGIPLTSNQVQYSLVYRYPELNGVKATCDELGVKVLAYSPLGLGALTGKFSEKLPSGPREGLAKQFVADPGFNDLIGQMKAVAAGKGGSATPSQVALAWCMAKGTIPIPGARNARQARDNVGALSLRLTSREVEDLDAAASKVAPVLKPEINPMVRESLDTKIKMFES